MVPTQLHINNLRPGESIEYVLHRHWITLVYTGGYVALLVVLLLIGIAFHGSITAIIPGPLFSLAMIAFAMVFSLFIYVYWVDNELDFYIVTNERIIAIEQLSFLNRTVRECSLDQVQEVNGFAKGLLENLLNFGSVTIRTASDTSEFKMDIAPQPLEHARIILNIIQEYKGTHRARMKSPDSL
jgi:membrane protein YdbS with pleckstrin-like domain